MQRLTPDGVRFSTRLMSHERALSFLRCLRGNARFQSAGLMREPKFGRWRVLYAPASADRAAVLLARQVQIRYDRAELERSGYTWWRDPDGPFWRVETLSRNTHEIDLEARECSCEDCRSRCRAAGIRCKHLLAFDLEQDDPKGTWRPEASAAPVCPLCNGTGETESDPPGFCECPTGQQQLEDYAQRAFRSEENRIERLYGGQR